MQVSHLFSLCRLLRALARLRDNIGQANASISRRFSALFRSAKFRFALPLAYNLPCCGTFIQSGVGGGHPRPLGSLASGLALSARNVAPAKSRCAVAGAGNAIGGLAAGNLHYRRFTDLPQSGGSPTDFRQERPPCRFAKSPHSLPVALALFAFCLRPSRLHTIAFLTANDPMPHSQIAFGHTLWSRPPPSA